MKSIEKYVFVKKEEGAFSNGLIIGLPQQASVEKDSECSGNLLILR